MVTRTTSLLTASMMTPMERAHGRFMRAPDHPESSTGGDNSQGNSGADNNQQSNQDNSGGGFDAASFWNEPEAVTEKAPGSPGSAADSKPASGESQQTFAQTFATQVDGLTFNPVFTDAITQKMAEGDMTGVNTALQDVGKHAVRNSVVMAARLMQENNAQLESRFKIMLDERFGTRDNDQTLTDSFPAAKDPALRPMIQSVFTQAMKLSKGDRTAAVAATKEMLKYMGKAGAADLGITEPPSNPGDTMTSDSRDLVAELLGRS